jgi:hypothetical protein
VHGRGLADNGAHALCPDDAPDEKGDTRRGRNYCLDREQMPDFVDWEPDRRKRDEPEQEKAHEVARRDARRRREMVRCIQSNLNRIFCKLREEARTDVLDARPHGAQHDLHAGAANTGLDAIPNAAQRLTGEDVEREIMHTPSHCASIEYAPQASPQPKTRACDNWKCDVKDSSGPRICNDERRNDAIADPYTYPRYHGCQCGK